jgi:pentatricopeptide repeat protein
MENMKRDNIALSSAFYDMIISGRSRLEPEHALRTLREMKAQGMLPIPNTYLSVIRAFCSLGDPNTVMQVLRDAERHIAIPVFGYFYAFESCTDNDNLEGALYCWNYFMRSGINVHEGGCLAILRLAANAGDGSLAGDILRHLTQQKYKFTAVHFEPLFSALVNSDDMAAFGVLDLMEKANIPISQDFVAAWTNRLATSKVMLDKGFGLLERIHKEGGEQGGRKIHTALFNGLLIASLRLRDPERVASYFEQISKLNVTPNTDSYNALLDACKIAQQPTMAVDLLAEMRENNVPITRATYERIIAAFCGVPAGESYEEAFQYLEETKSAGYVPTESMYVMIVRKCARERDPRANIAMEEMETIGYTVGHNLRRYVEAGGITELLGNTSNDRKNNGNRLSQQDRFDNSNNNNDGFDRQQQQQQQEGFDDYNNRTHGELADS